MPHRNGEYYLYWWHPHNFGNDPKRPSMNGMELLITHYKSLQVSMECRSLEHEKYPVMNSSKKAGKDRLFDVRRPDDC